MPLFFGWSGNWRIFKSATAFFSRLFTEKMKEKGFRDDSQLTKGEAKEKKAERRWSHLADTLQQSLPTSRPAFSQFQSL